MAGRWPAARSLWWPLETSLNSDWRPTGDMGGSRFPQWLFWWNPKRSLGTLVLEPRDSPFLVQDPNFRAPCSGNHLQMSVGRDCWLSSHTPWHFRCPFFMCHPPNETRHTMDELQSWGGQLPGLISWLPCSVTFGTLINLSGPPVLYCKTETIHSANNESLQRA